MCKITYRVNSHTVCKTIKMCVNYKLCVKLHKSPFAFNMEKFPSAQNFYTHAVTDNYQVCSHHQSATFHIIHHSHPLFTMLMIPYHIIIHTIHIIHPSLCQPFTLYNYPPHPPSIFVNLPHDHNHLPPPGTLMTVGWTNG